MIGDLGARVGRAPGPVYLVVGSARPVVLEAVAAIEAAVLKLVVLPAFHHEAVWCSDASPERALLAARTAPMLGDRRLVVVRAVEQGSDAFFEALEGYLARPSPTTTLLLCGESLPKQEKGRPAWARRVPEAVKKAGGEVLTWEAAQVDVPRLASDRATALGKRLEPAAARLLIETVGSELDRVLGEVDKLVSYVGAEPVIGVDAVRATCALLAEAQVWDLTAALAARDRAGTISALYRLQELEEEPRRVLSMVAYQARQLVAMAELARAGASDDVIQRAARMRWDTFKRVRPTLDQVPPAAELLGRIARANRDMNFVRADAERVLDALVLELLV